jgi:hypothetical protein
MKVILKSIGMAAHLANVSPPPASESASANAINVPAIATFKLSERPR